MNIFIMVVAAVGCFIMAFFCGYWALHKVQYAKEDQPHYEYAIKQLTAGAWTFGLLFVACMVGATFFTHSDSQTPSETTQEPVIINRK